MRFKSASFLVSLGVFMYATVIYVLTVAPTASFWDAGEFIAIAHGLQVSHPPGAPFYMLVGRLFSMFAPDLLVSLSVNMVSVLSSSFTILLAYWIIVRLLKQFIQTKTEGQPTFLHHFGGVIGACTFAVTDSFWFNAVEAEVYAMSMLFTALVIWLILKWAELADEELRMKNDRLGLDANRILILVAYLFGLAIGVHLLSILALFFIAMIVFFVEFDKKEWTITGQPEWRSAKRWKGILLMLIVASVIFLGIYPGIVQTLPGIVGATGQPLLTLLVLMIAVTSAVWITHSKRLQTANLISVCVLMVLIGYSSYAVIFIRSAADPPIDENDPEAPEAIVSYLKREQYGDTPILNGATFNDRTGNYDEDHIKPFPRRHSPSPQHVNVYRQYSSDLEYFWKYQLGHMYLRYFLWNFSGRESDVEGARAITGIPILDRSSEVFQESPSEKASRNRYFALPLLLGFFGMFYHFRRDWKHAFSVLVLFLVTGVGIILYLNQTPLQPRERDYAYVASFMAFAFWIGIGATGLLQLIREAVNSRLVMQIAPFIIFLLVPGWMAIENYNDHDRSGRYIAPDYAYNMLMSVAENGILFTNGDNDTFPLWYAQEVEKIRRDVRVANLSLLNTPWYVRQLKNQYSRESTPLPIGLSESEINDLGARLWEPNRMTLPVDPNLFSEDSDVFIGLTDRSQLDSTMTWVLNGRPYTTNPETGEPLNLLYGADIATLSIITGIASQDWTRPVYFAVTVSNDGRLDLENYLQLEGQALRIVPIRHDEPLGRVELGVTPQRLRQFRFRNLNNPDVYYDANIRRMVDNYRNIFSHAASAMVEAGQVEEGIALMDSLMEKIPFSTIPGDFISFIYVARVYQLVGDFDRALQIFRTSEPRLLHRLKSGDNDQFSQFSLTFLTSVRAAYLQAADYEGAAEFENKIRAVFGGEEEVTAEEMRELSLGLFNGNNMDDTSSIENSTQQDSRAEDIQDEN